MPHSALRGSSVILPADIVGALPWQSNDWGGLSRLLWEDRQTGSIAGILALAPSEVHDRHRHVDVTHHIWVLSGSIRIGDEQLGRGSYACMRAGTPHGPEVAGSEGCQLFYVIVPDHAAD